MGSRTPSLPVRPDALPVELHESSTAQRNVAEAKGTPRGVTITGTIRTVMPVREGTVLGNSITLGPPSGGPKRKNFF